MRMPVKCVGILSVVFVAASIGLTAQQSAPDAAGSVATLPPPYKIISYTGTKPAGATAPFFSHGYLIQFKHQVISAGATNIYLWNSSGQLEDEVAIWPEGAAKLFLTSVDVGASGQLGFAGALVKTDGSVSLFIATSDVNGQNPKYFDTGRYRASQIALADDGSIWAVGAEHNALTKSGGITVTRWNNYDVLRHYSSTGSLIEHFLPRWEAGVASVIVSYDSSGHETLAAYDSQGAPATTVRQNDALWSYAAAGDASSQKFLRSSGSNTVLYNGLNRTFYRYTAAKGLLSQGAAFDYGTKEKITGFTLSSDGDIYASLKNPDPQHPFSLGPFTLRFSNSGGLARWSRISQDTSTNMQGFTVLGSDGPAVVYRDKTGSVNWSAAESTTETNSW
jgi:hypothetical protein